MAAYEHEAYIYGRYGAFSVGWNGSINGARLD